jgi:RNA polymerase sigma-70 factor (ECF subfamily)
MTPISQDEGLILELALQNVASTPAAVRDRRLRSMVEGHFDTVWRTLKRLGVPEAGVDDAAQQVFLVASRRLNEICVGHERRYLLGVAVRVASDARHALERRREVPIDDALDHVLAQRALLPDEVLDDKRMLAVLTGILSKMPSDMCEAFVLFELEGLTAAEVAQTLDIPVGTVASRVRRARGHVRLHLSRRGGAR